VDAQARRRPLEDIDRINFYGARRELDGLTATGFFVEGFSFALESRKHRRPLLNGSHEGV
jgi:hypothetical protein